MLDPERELRWLRRVRDLSHALVSERDLGRLLPRILDAAIEITEAERGFLVRAQTRRSGRPRIKIEIARGFARESLQGTRGSVSRTVVRRVLDQGRGIVTTREEDADLLDVPSVQERRVLSILAVPLQVGEAPWGVLYLDHRFHRAVFAARDLEILGTFAQQAALALETAELRTARQAAPAPVPPAEPPVPGAGARGPRFRLGGLIGGSAAMQRLYQEIERMAPARGPVLIQGPSGTGKELVARELHARSGRASSPLLSINCAALTDTLLASELFGYRKGAFTGAERDTPGLFARAGVGTLFLDEVGDTSPAMQAKLLRVLEEKEVRPVGGHEAITIRCRILAATHRDLEALSREGAFRADLYYRLDVLRLRVPPLRERPDDLLQLVEHFVEEAGAKPLSFTDKARELLLDYAWPGNVRQLRNEVLRLLATGTRPISHPQLSDEVRQGGGVARAGGKTLNEMERAMIAAALRDCGGNKARAARQLGIPRSTLYRLIERHQLG